MIAVLPYSSGFCAVPWLRPAPTWLRPPLLDCGRPCGRLSNAIRRSTSWTAPLWQDASVVIFHAMRVNRNDVSSRVKEKVALPDEAK